MGNPQLLNQTQLSDVSDAFFSHGQTVIFRCSSDTGMPIEFVSSNVVENLGYSSDELTDGNQSFLSLLHMDDLLAFQDAILNLSSHQSESFELEYRLKHVSGNYVWFHDVLTPVYDEEGVLIAFYDCTHNISAQKEAESTIKHFKKFDSLTNLPNRHSLINKLNQSISNAKSKRLYGCVISINLDRFKYINNSYGFEIGDKLLKELSSRLRKAVRPQDIVARVNADEFVCVLTDIHQDKDAVNRVAEKTTLKIREIIGQSYKIGDMTLKIGASCGVCIYPEKDFEADDIIKFSDVALGQAKLSGQNNIHFFDEKMHQENTRSINLERDLMIGLNEKQLELYFQPIVSNDRNIIAFESLLRWQHPQRGEISPSEFIPVAENTGLLQKLGEYVIERACEQLAIWEKDNIVADGRIKYVSVNISPNQFWHTDFAKHLSQNIENRGIDPKHLLLEITENIFIADLQDAIHIDCDAYQGFYFYRPSPLAELDCLLQKKPEVGFNDFNNTTEIPMDSFPLRARNL